jgi:hypothetical protein
MAGPRLPSTRWQRASMRYPLRRGRQWGETGSDREEAIAFEVYASIGALSSGVATRPPATVGRRRTRRSCAEWRRTASVSTSSSASPRCLPRPGVDSMGLRTTIGWLPPFRHEAGGAMRSSAWIYDDETRLAARSQTEAVAFTGEYVAFTVALRTSGHYLGGEALDSVRTATTVRVRRGRVSARRALRRNEGAAGRLLSHRGPGLERGDPARRANPVGAPGERGGAAGRSESSPGRRPHGHGQSGSIGQARGPPGDGRGGPAAECGRAPVTPAGRVTRGSVGCSPPQVHHVLADGGTEALTRLACDACTS